MHILILHQHVSANCAPDELDVYEQVKHVSSALQTLGHTFESFAVTGDFAPLRAKLETRSARLVFNLVESIEGQDARMAEVPQLLEELNIHYTGSNWWAIEKTNDKVEAKDLLRSAKLPTPDWTTLSNQRELAPPYIVKACREHASRGMDASSLVTSSTNSVQAEIRRRTQLDGMERFAEAYIDGREFNISLLAGERGPEVLPLAEIDFSAFEPGRPRFVDYNAKWNPESFEYQNTPRVFVGEENEPEFCRRMRDSAVRCWGVFRLHGYARVDFRVDPQGQPWILEVNCNPCLSPDAGFAAALERAGIPWPQAVERILADPVRPDL